MSAVICLSCHEEKILWLWFLSCVILPVLMIPCIYITQLSAPVTIWIYVKKSKLTPYLPSYFQPITSNPIFILEATKSESAALTLSKITLWLSCRIEILCLPFVPSRSSQMVSHWGGLGLPRKCQGVFSLIHLCRLYKIHRMQSGAYSAGVPIYV